MRKLGNAIEEFGIAAEWTAAGFRRLLDDLFESFKAEHGRKLIARQRRRRGK